MNDNKGDSLWYKSPEELAAMIAGNPGLHTQKAAEAVLQAKTNLEAARRVAEEARNTTKATWVLAIATWALVVVDVILRIFLRG